MVTGHLIERNDAFFVVLSKEQVAQLGVRAGDTLKVDTMIESFNSESSVEGIQPPQPEISEALKIARQVIAENREALRELAK